MTIIALPAFKDNYIWCIIHEHSYRLGCVDPGDPAPVLAYLQKNKLHLHYILLTHHHADHSAGIPTLLHAFPHTLVYAPFDTRLSFSYTPVYDEDILHLEELAFRVLSTPGHTATAVSYQELTHGLLFCGDTLFSAGCGRVFDGTIQALYQSLLLFQTLPDNTKIYCGHEYTRENIEFAVLVDPENEVLSNYRNELKTQPLQCSLPSTIALEKKINPFMRTAHPSLQRYFQCDTPSSFNLFQQLRALKDTFKTQ